MATVLTEPAVDEGTVHVSFPILKWEQDADGDLVITGVATDGTVDHDGQIVQPEWSALALDQWISSGGNVRQSHNPMRPIGKGLKVEVNKEGTGKHHVTSVIVDRDAQRLIKKGVLTAYSVGISRPVIKHDPTGRAPGGIIAGGELCELSVVDRPSNKNSYLQLAKSAEDGTCEFTGKMIGDTTELLEKAAEAELTKAVAPAEPAATDTWTPPGDLSINFTPNDMMRLMQSKFVSQHYDELARQAVDEAERAVYKRDIGASDRRRIAGEGNAVVGSDGHISYPIENSGDLQNAATLARSGHGDVAAARRLIARRARELGVSNPLDESDEVKKVSGDEPTMAAAEAVAESAVEAVKEAEPDVIKDPEPEAKPKPVKKAKKKPKKLPPWLNKPKDGDDAESDSDSSDGACKGAHVWSQAGTVECLKCHTTPAEAAGVAGSHPMQAAPVPELLETPPVDAMKSGPTPASASGAVAASMESVPAHREPDGAINDPFEADAGLSDGDAETPTRLEAPMVKGQPEVSAMLRFKTIGIDEDLGRLHDLTCPAYHPDDVAKYHPFAEFATVIDAQAWMRKALAAAAGPTDEAKAMAQMWNSVAILKAADPGMLNDFRLAAYKAFRDANPGPATYPTPGSMSPQRFCRPLVTDGHEASSPGHDGPNSSPSVASSAPNAHSFDRPPLAAGHQSPSPSHMKQGGGEYPSAQGAPVQLQYAHMEKDQARMALVRAHDQLSRQFPEVCPLDSPDSRPLRSQQPEGHPVPAVAGIGKGEEEPEVAKSAAPEVPPAPVAAVLKAPAEVDGQFMDADVYKGFKKMRKKLGKKVLSGAMTVDEARARMGRQFAQKAAEPAEAQPEVTVNAEKGLSAPQVRELTEAVQRALLEQAHRNRDAALTKAATPAPVPVAAALDPEVIKAAVAEATSELKDLLVKQQETFTTKLAEQQRVIDAIADQPDPSTAAFSGLAYRPALTKAARPAGVTEIAESHAAQARHLVRQELENTYYTHSDPAAREAAAQAIARLGSGGHTMT